MFYNTNTCTINKQIQFHNIFNCLFVQRGFNFVLKELLNPFMLVSTSETILEYFCPEGFAQSVHACVDLRNYFRIFFVQKGLLNPFMLVLTSETILKYFCPEGLLVLTSESILEYFCLEGFAQFVYACFFLRKYFRISLSRRVCSIHSCLFCPQKLFQNIFLKEGLLINH